MKNIVYVFLFLSIFFSNCAGRKNEIISVSAKELIADYQSSMQYGNRKYRGNALIVEGTVAEYYRNKKNEVSIILREKNQKYGVKCNIVRSNKQITKPVKYGEKIKIKGICLGFKDDNVLMENCFIIK